MLPIIRIPAFRFIWREVFMTDSIDDTWLDDEGDVLHELKTQAFMFTGIEFGPWRFGLETELSF